MGNANGEKGQSLNICITGEKIGLWHDFATGEHGDMFHLTQANQHMEFPEALRFVANWLGVEAKLPRTEPAPAKETEEQSQAGGSWPSYWQMGLPGWKREADRLCLSLRHTGRKRVSPWDVKAGKHRAPSPRPLYNQKGIRNAKGVVLVEGEKCAQAMIDAGICATTAMNGAKAPVNKTDWSPLKGKGVLIWPDNDQPGRDYAEAAAQAILKVGAESCAILIPPAGKPEKWDAADAVVELDEQENPFDIPGFLSGGERTPVLLKDSDQGIQLPGDIDLVTDDGITEAFNKIYKDDWRYCDQWGKWFAWTGQRWSPDQVLYVYHLSRNICREAALLADSDRQRSRLASNSTIQNVVKMARSTPCHASLAEDWDRDPWLLNTPDGVVNLKTGELRGHQRNDMMTRITTASPEGNCPRWLQFLDDVTGGDQALVDYLQKVVGYCLTGVTSEHALFFLHGGGANGKSVFVHVLMSILGNYSANAPVETFMESRHEKHPTDLASLARSKVCLECGNRTGQAVE